MNNKITTLAREDKMTNNGQSMALKGTRFTNLLLTSVLAGNGVGSLLFVHPALRTLSLQDYFVAERALTFQYPKGMLVLMPAAVGSCLAALALSPHRESASFRLTLAGTACLIGMLGTTLAELPLNKRTRQASLESPPADWLELRARWERFNQLRTLCEVAGWGFLYLAALAEAKEGED
jgi:uncharacterized membrane protein